MLSAFSWLYSKIIDQRNLRYESGTFKTHSLSVPVISVGNITVGGTGKTPLVALIAEILSDNGEKVCVISRGYKRSNPKKRVLVSDGGKILADVNVSGDEPFELARELLGKAIVIADADRVNAGKWATREFGVSAIVLDDAFQHRKIARDIDIVTIDATNPFGNEKTLPGGILREPIENLARADAIVITRANLTENLDALKTKITNFNQHATILESENKISELIKLSSFSPDRDETQETVPVKDLADQTALAFCALGNPENFYKQLELEGLIIKKTKAFTDHYNYSQRDIARLESLATKHKCKALLTTVKDAVKLYQLDFKRPCYVVKNELVIREKKKLREMIDAVSKP